MCGTLILRMRKHLELCALPWLLVALSLRPLTADEPVASVSYGVELHRDFIVSVKHEVAEPGCAAGQSGLRAFTLRRP
jgi:hypothetical protein